MLNISFPDKKTLDLIEQEVGASFSLKDRLKLKGVGSARLLIVDSSEDIKELTSVNQDLIYCNVELRPKGIIIRFRSLLDTYAFVISYPQLSLYQNAERWSFHKGGQRLNVVPEMKASANRKFLIKLLNQKATLSGGPND